MQRQRERDNTGALIAPAQLVGLNDLLHAETEEHNSATERDHRRCTPLGQVPLVLDHREATSWRHILHKSNKKDSADCECVSADLLCALSTDGTCTGAAGVFMVRTKPRSIGESKAPSGQ